MKSWPHFRQEVSEDGGVPTICFDYCFLRDHPGGESVPVLVGREKKTKMMIAHVVPFKGGGVDWLVGQLIRDLRKIGVHGKVVLKRTRFWTCSTMSASRGERKAIQLCPSWSRVLRENRSPMVLLRERCKILKRESERTS